MIKLRSSLFVITILVMISGCSSTHDEPFDYTKPLSTSAYFEFYSSPWVNLHHFLYNYAKWQKESLAIDSIYQQLLIELGPYELTKFNQATQYYGDHLIGDDLRTGDKNHPLKLWLIEQKNDSLPENPHLPGYSQVINDFYPIYQDAIWEFHHSRNFAVLDDNIVLIRSVEEEAVQQLELLTQGQWQREKIRVDISYHSKYERPYTNTRPEVYIVMDSKKNHQPAGNWLELLLHEASHHLIFADEGYIGSTIIDAGKRINKKLPRALSHIYLFYFSGKVAQELLAKQGIENYELYMFRNRVFEWSHPIIEKHLTDYLKSQTGLDQATEQVILDANELFDQQ